MDAEKLIATLSKSFRHVSTLMELFIPVVCSYQRVGTCEDEADLAAAEFFHYLECWNKPPGKVRS